MWARVLCVAMVVASVGWVRADLPRPSRPEKLQGELGRLSYFLGTWEINGAWSSGQKLHARNEFRIGLGGRFMEITTSVRDGDGPVYERYRTIYQHTPDGFVGHGFVFDGTAKSVPVEVTFEPTLKMRTELTENGTTVRNDAIRIDDDSYAWKVWVRGADDAEWVSVMDGVWKRVKEAAEVGPIEAAAFVGSGSDVRRFTKVATIAAPVERVFAAWSTAAGWRGVYDAPPSRARIDLAIGGRYEWLFDGEVGSNGCQVLSYIPDRMISFSWNAPPGQPESRARRTWVVVELAPVAAGTRVTLTHLGFGTGSQWDETYAYFDAAWERVLAVMSEKLSAGSE